MPLFMAAGLLAVPRGYVPARPDEARSAPVVSIDIPPRPLSLKEKVEAHVMPARHSREMECLARTVYFESRGEKLEGQLAVALTVINRTRSGMFPDTICKVVRQSGQFSFVHGHVIPEIEDKTSKAWHNAVAIAAIARRGWPSRAARALYFHATYVDPDRDRPMIGTIGRHRFYA